MSVGCRNCVCLLASFTQLRCDEYHFPFRNWSCTGKPQFTGAAYSSFLHVCTRFVNTFRSNT